MTERGVVIVGGGPAGSFVAAALARAGVDVLLVERAAFPRAKACAEFLSPECARLLGVMGVLDRCERSSHAELEGMIVRAPGGGMIRGMYGDVEAHRPCHARALSIRREVLDTILLERAAELGADVRERARVSDLLRRPDGRVSGVRLLGRGSGSEEIRARVVIGADGLRSVVAQRLGLRRRARLPRRLGLVGHWTGVADVREVGEMHVEHDGYVGLADVGGGVTNMSLVVPASRAGEIAGAATAFYERWLRARTQLAPRLRDARRLGAVLVTGPFATTSRRAWAPGAALVGDAADYFDPFTGEGIHSALRGGELLAVRLLEGLPSPDDRGLQASLRAYHRERRAEMAPKRLVERAIALFVATPALMNHAAAAFARRPAMASLLAGVCGDFIPPRRVLDPRYILRLIALPLLPARRTPASAP